MDLLNLSVSSYAYFPIYIPNKVWELTLGETEAS